MNYTSCFNELKSLYSHGKDVIELPGSKVSIRNISFSSDFPSDGFLNHEDPLIAENNSFSYPVFIPAAKSRKVILLLHGLNERSWLKYLVWANWLSEYTSSYVILFPISFHINRSPESWKDPRIMVPYLNDRNMTLGKTSMSSFANVALSNRLTEDPMRFYNSGYQTVTDLIKLLMKVRSGKHEVIPGGCKLNIFAYSIGAFLAQIIVMGNPEALFTESKLFIFCGGSFFSNMNGSSKLIMDSHAFEKVYNFYLNDFESKIRTGDRTSNDLWSGPIGMAFRSMIDRSRFKTFRETILRKLKDQIQCLVLQKDNVIPAPGVVETFSPLKNKSIVKICDFPYTYSHENPFPVFNSVMSKEVDRSFELVFSSAESFLR
jgi:hypothetical protein